jgi:hypothetical protein
MYQEFSRASRAMGVSTALTAVLLSCGAARTSLPHDGALAAATKLDAQGARRVVGALSIAVAARQRVGVEAAFSIRDLAVAFQPRRVLRVSPAVERRFADELIARLFKEKSALRTMLVGIEVGEATLEGQEAIVLGRSGRGDLRLRVAVRDGRLKVIRIE